LQQLQQRSFDATNWETDSVTYIRLAQRNFANVSDNHLLKALHIALNIRINFFSILRSIFFSLSSLGSMLRPLLEQAADPIHQHKTGTGLNLFPPSAKSSTASKLKATESSEKPTNSKIERIPSTVLLFKQQVIINFQYEI
jgi:hypothetical protein